MKRMMPLLTLLLVMAMSFVTVPGVHATSVSLLVASASTGSVLRYDGTTGAFLGPFVPSGSGGLIFPYGLALGPDSNLYVSDLENRSVLRYNGATGAFIDAFVPPLGLILRDVAFGPDGNLYLGSAGLGGDNDGTIRRYNSTTGAFMGDFVISGSGGLDAPTDMAFGPDGNLYVANDGGDPLAVLRYNGTTGAFMGTFTSNVGFINPTGLTFGPDGSLYVSDWPDGVLRYNGTTGAFIGTFASSGIGGPSGLAFGPDGNLYVSNFLTDSVLRYDGTTGAFLGTFAIGGGLDNPRMLVFAPSAPDVPEPASLALLGSGLAGLAAWRRKLLAGIKG